MIKDDYIEETNRDVYDNSERGTYCDDYVHWLETKLQLMQTDVSGRRELLFAYEKMRTNHIVGGTDDWRYSNVDLFLSK
tara:strand:- start:1355 stop:1591 length:237 start_codon:yes stop_codon:yes gene_type:complete